MILSAICVGHAQSLTIQPEDNIRLSDIECMQKMKHETLLFSSKIHEYPGHKRLYSILRRCRLKFRDALKRIADRLQSMWISP